MNNVKLFSKPLQLKNFTGGQWISGQGDGCKILSPYTNEVIGEFNESTKTQVNDTATNASKAFEDWKQTPIKERTQIMFKFREALLNNIEEISNTISVESGKTLNEAKAGLMKGIEVLEYAISIQNLDKLGKLEVSRGVHCEYRREPLGVVAGITPFNFPAMVPMWMIPIAITAGNAFIWKPSDKTPLTSMQIANAFVESGLPDGVFNIVQGGKLTVDALLENPIIKAIGFVGSTKVAKYIYQTGSNNLKRVLALGGAKNHIFLLPDADITLASHNIADSFTGCAGQRCMAASVLLAIGDVDHIIGEIVERARSLQVGIQMGAIISKESLTKLETAIEKSKNEGAKILLDGRNPKIPKEFSGTPFENGNWLAPTILDNVKPDSQAACDELFGPILSIIRCKNMDEAMNIENKSPYGNAASVFTQNGGAAEYVSKHARAGMVGINIGVPVPREPFSFGGFYDSRFGHGDITGESGLSFWTDLRKVTTKWADQKDKNWMS